MSEPTTADQAEAPSRGPNPVGSVIWYEVMTDQPEAVAAFYHAIYGWTVTPAGSAEETPTGMDYRMVLAPTGQPVGGLLVLDEERKAHGAQPAWMIYFLARDVAATVAAMEADGATVLLAPVTISEGTFALLSDPAGGLFYVMDPVPPPGAPDGVSHVFDRTEPGKGAWNELVTRDVGAAKAFYARHFGHNFDQSMPMGPDRTYWFIGHHDGALGGLVEAADTSAGAGWVPYFRATNAGEAHAAVAAHGGTALFPPQDVPGGEQVFLARDPAGALFGVVARAT